MHTEGILVKCDRGRRNTTVLSRHEKRPDWGARDLELEGGGGEVCGSGVDVVIFESRGWTPVQCGSW